MDARTVELVAAFVDRMPSGAAGLTAVFDGLAADPHTVRADLP